MLLKSSDMLFKENDWYFKLTVPEYETPIFGGLMGEIRVVSKEEFLDQQYFKYIALKDYLSNSDLLACTFRGKEDTPLIMYLQSLGFMFVGTFSNVLCTKANFRILSMFDRSHISLATEDDYEHMSNIQARVFDYSTHQLDPRLNTDITSKRNVLRLQSYFNRSGHRVYVYKLRGAVLGYLQFIVGDGTATCVNGAVDPDYHGMFVGAPLYSYAFNDLFINEECNSITSAFCNQNKPVSKLHQALGFKIMSHEVHLRLII